MKYIKNTGRYAIAFVITKNKREFRLELDKRRIYMDTGNIATTGITPVEDEDLEELKKIKRFNTMVENEELTILDESEVKTPEENKIKALEEKNRELEEKLQKAENADVKKVEEEKKALADENESLKAQLEALTKGKKGQGKDKDTEAEADAGTDEEAKDEKAKDEKAKDEKAVDTEGF